MNRQSTDLLDFFGSKGTKKSGGARARASAPREPRSALVLGRAHVLLGAAGAVVLMLLSFVVGLSVGRRKAAGSGPALVVTSPVRGWSIRSRTMPRVGSGAQTLIEVAQREFAAKFPLLAPHLETQRVFDKKGNPVPGEFRLLIKGFPTRDAAESWCGDLRVWVAADYVPFHGASPEQLGDLLPAEAR